MEDRCVSCEKELSAKEKKSLHAHEVRLCEDCLDAAADRSCGEPNYGSSCRNPYEMSEEEARDSGRGKF